MKWLKRILKINARYEKPSGTSFSYIWVTKITITYGDLYTKPRG